MSFVVELSITEKCNLGCPYCYVANKNKFMNYDTFLNVVSKIKQYCLQSGEKDYIISYFGGEPLLNFELIKKAHEYFKNDPMCRMETIISNMSLLNSEIYEYIKTNNIGVSWSFDGKDANVSRPLLPIRENNGYKNILDIYTKNKNKLIELSNGYCKVMIYPENCSSLVENFEFLLDFGINYPDFSIVRDNVWTNKDILIFKGTLHKLADLYISKVKSGIDCSIGFFRLHFLDTLFSITKGKRPFGCFAGTSGCSVSPDGKFYPCQRFASKNVLEYGDVHNFQYYKDMFSPLKYKKCKDCDLYLICSCGCNFSQLLNDNSPLDSVCELYHIIEEETLRVTHELKNVPTFRKIVDRWIHSIG